MGWVGMAVETKGIPMIPTPPLIKIQVSDLEIDEIAYEIVTRVGGQGVAKGWGGILLP